MSDFFAGYKKDLACFKGDFGSTAGVQGDFGSAAGCHGEDQSRAGIDREIVRKGLEIGDGEPTDTLDRPGRAYAEAAYAGAGKIQEGDKEGAYAGAGILHARGEWRGFDAEASGPNASAGYQFSDESAKIMAKAEVASASASVGPAKATVGLALDTGVGVGKSGIEAKVLGTGFSIGRKTGFSIFGTGFEIDFGKL